VLRRDPPFEGLVLHGLNGIYLQSLAKWVRLDARGNTEGINAQFSLDKEQLAFPMVDNAGEFIYETIFCKLASCVVDILRRFNSRNEMWPYLPAALDEANA